MKTEGTVLEKPTTGVSEEKSFVGVSDGSHGTENAPSLFELVMAMAAAERIKGKFIAISDTRYITAGIPRFITKDYIYFEEGIEVGQTGELGGEPKEYEPIPQGGKIILWQAVLAIDTIKKPSDYDARIKARKS